MWSLATNNCGRNSRTKPSRAYTAGTHEYVLVESGTLRLTEVWSGWLVLTTRRRSGC